MSNQLTTISGYPMPITPVDHVEPVPRRIRAELGGHVVRSADLTRGGAQHALPARRDPGVAGGRPPSRQPPCPIDQLVAAACSRT